MDPQRARIEEDLRGLIAGEVHCDDVYVQLYATDASIYQIRPLGVVMPRSAADVSAVVQYCHEQQISIHARGAGTGLAGESLGPGLIVDFSKYMRRIVGTDGETVRVQPGVVHERLNQFLRPAGRLFGPDPAMSHVTTMGSVLALDSCGSHWLKHGSPRRHIVSMQVVLSGGEIVELGNEQIPDLAVNPEETPSRRQQIVGELAALLSREQALIAAKQPKSLVNRAGYHLPGLVKDGRVDVSRLLVGSEGTLALITEATLATQMLARHQGLAVLFFERLESASRAVLEILPYRPTACDLIDRRHLTLARELDVRYESLIPANAEAMLLVEIDGAEQAEVRDHLRQIVDRIRRRKRLAFDARMVFAPEETELIWRTARQVSPNLHRVRGEQRAVPFVEDFAVPPAALPEFLVTLQNILKRRQVIASLFAHAGHGQLHVRPFLDLGDPQDVQKMAPLAADLYHAVWNAGGTISGEHGCGLSRTPFVREQYGDLYPVFREVKRIFDPHGLFSPGRVVWDETTQMTDHLRPATNGSTAGASLTNSGLLTASGTLTGSGLLTQSGSFSSSASHPPAPANGPALKGETPANAAATVDKENKSPATEDTPKAPGRTFAPQLAWPQLDVLSAARQCNGCGACRVQSSEGRMCPIFRFAPSETASPRSKANLLRGFLDREADPSFVQSAAFKEVADQCVNCQMCRLECPASVDIPRMMIEAKAAYVAEHGYPLVDWALSRQEKLCSLGSRFPLLANRLLDSWQIRWLLEKTFGLSRVRKLPRFARGSFLRRAAKKRITRPSRRSGRKVLYFVDLYANYFDPQLAEATVAVFDHNQVSVFVHPQLRESGMTSLSLGIIDRARQLAEHNLPFLAEAVRQGYTIVASEPSAALCLKREYPALVDDDDARLVADNTQDACDYLWKMNLSGELQLDLRPVNAALGYHAPCHSKALEHGSPAWQLLRLIPGLTVDVIEKGCSGMAGPYGLKQENFRNSLRAGWGLIAALRDARLLGGTTECSACKMQMEQGAAKPTLHPLKLLALSYGLAPEVASLLSAKGEEQHVT